jgi:hypothetical protein
MSWILLGLLLEEREAFDFSDSLLPRRTDTRRRPNETSQSIGLVQLTDRFYSQLDRVRDKTDWGLWGIIGGVQR